MPRRTCRLRLLWILPALAGGLGALPRRALAGDPGPASVGADPHAARGRQLERAGDYEGALRELDAANRAPNADPMLWYDLGFAYQALHRDAEAMDAFEKFIVRADAAPPELRARAQRFISDLDARNPPPASVAKASRPPERSASRSKAPWIAAGGAGLLGAGALVAGLSARSRYQALRDGCGRTESGCSPGDIDGVSRRVLLTNVLLGLAAGSAVVAGVLVVVDVTSQSKEVAVAWRF